MDYNINFKYKSGGGTASSGMGAIAGMRQKAIQASQKQVPGLTRLDDSPKRLIDSNIKISTNILKLNQSITMLTATIKNKGIGGGGGGDGIGLRPSITHPQGNTGIGSVGAALGYIGVPVALAGFAVQKINQIGNAYIDKVSQQRGTAGIGGFRTQREGAYLGAEVSSAYKAHRMAAGTFKGEVSPEAFKMGTIFGQSAEEVGKQSGVFARYGASYGQTLKQGLGTGIQTDIPKMMTGIASELEEAVRNGVNASNLSGDIGKEVASLTSNTQTKSVDMALGMINKFKSIQSSAAKGQIGSLDTLMSWKAGQTKLMESLNTEERGGTINQWVKQGLIDKETGKILRTGDISKGGKIDMEFLRKAAGQGGVSALTKDVIESMNPAEGLRTNIQQYQKQWGTGAKAMQSAYSVYAQTGGSMTQKEFSSAWRNANNPLVEDQTKKGKKILKKEFDEFEKSAPMLGVKKAQMMDDLLYKYGNSFASASLKIEKELIKLADTLAGTVIPLLDDVAKGKKILPIKRGNAGDYYDTSGGGFKGTRG